MRNEIKRNVSKPERERTLAEREIELDKIHSEECETCFKAHSNKCECVSCFNRASERELRDFESEITESEIFEKNIRSAIEDSKKKNCSHRIRETLRFIDAQNKAIIFSNICLECESEISFRVVSGEKFLSQLKNKCEYLRVRFQSVKALSSGDSEELTLEDKIKLRELTELALEIQKTEREIVRLEKIFSSGKYSE